MKQNSSIKIESGIPVPLKASRASKYRFAKLKVGQSFFAHGKKAGDLSAYVAYTRLKCPKARFTMRTMDGGVRVWRIA